MKQTTEPLWNSGIEKPRYAPLSGELEVDVVIVGGGITGLTAAHLLKREGRTVAVIEKGEVGGGETGHTTAHLTELIDTRYYDLVSDYGVEGARLAAESSRLAIDTIADLASKNDIACDFERVPAYLYTEPNRDAGELKLEKDAAEQAGLMMTLLDEAPLPFATGPALRIENQAQFHPRKYLLGLARLIPGAGSHIFEDTHAVEIHDGVHPWVKTEHGRVRAKEIIVAANAPLAKFKLVTKVAAYRTYAIAVPLNEPLAERALFWDTEEPYHYIRVQNIHGQEFLVVGGADHKVGMEEETGRRFNRLEEYTRRRFKAAGPARFRWSGQVLEPVDGLPYIGKNPLGLHLRVATGFSGNGMTFGTLAGRMCAEEILGRRSPYHRLYRPSRLKPFAGVVDYMLENKDFPLCLISDYVAPKTAPSVEAIAPGHGALIDQDGKKLAVYREPGGGVRACSAVCPHMGCLVHFNVAERSWDCPCHGSRFDTDGHVLNGPALTDLAPATVEPAKKEKGAA